MPPATLYSSGIGKFTPEGLADAFRKYGASLQPSALRAAKASGKIVQRHAVRRFAQRGVGKGIFGRRESGAFKLIKTAAGIRGASVVVGLELHGFAALQEKGGRTRQHIIEPKNRKALRIGGSRFFRSRAVARGGFDAHSGFAMRVRHPGSTIKRLPFAQEAFLASMNDIKALFSKELTKFRTGGVAIVSQRAA